MSTNATKAKIQPYFDPAFVGYEVGAVTAIPAAKSVKYIGLWKNDAPHQLDWNTIKAKVAAEVPTAEELAAAEGPAGAARDAARAAITAKAQAWVNRIDAAFATSIIQWNANGGLANNALVAIKHYHPKYSPNGGDAATNEWPAWVRVTAYSGTYTDVDPDAEWTHWQGGSHADGIVSVPTGIGEDRMKIVIAHEAGHATKASFKRQVFGPTLDHSTAAGLMDPSGSQDAFSDREKKILRGITP